jgi:hypothetical protein
VKYGWHKQEEERMSKIQYDGQQAAFAIRTLASWYERCGRAAKARPRKTQRP